eukprot:scaffold38249_cov30-Tisochrysis_lutea.AAC.2
MYTIWSGTPLPPHYYRLDALDELSLPSAVLSVPLLRLRCELLVRYSRVKRWTKSGTKKSVALFVCMDVSAPASVDKSIHGEMSRRQHGDGYPSATTWSTARTARLAPAESPATATRWAP